MEPLTTRTGGERETQAGKLIPSFVIDTAGAPATSQSSAPLWIELLPAGVFYGRDGRGPFRLDDPHAVIESTRALQMSAGLPIDYDHATDFGAPEGRPAPAAGWIRELRVRAGALWGRVEWTARAADSIVAREYRYVSPVFQFDPKTGAALADGLSDVAQRELLKSAVSLHRFRGTPFAVKQALAALGWTQVNLLEGEAIWGGTAYPPNEGWAVFRVMIDLVVGQGVPSGAVSKAAAAVKFFKPARALLDSIWFVTPPVADVAPDPSDIFTLGGIVKYQIDAMHIPTDSGLAIAIVSAAMADGYGPAAPIYDRHYRHSGITYGVNEPEVADSALVVNGAAVLHGG
jgi:hypothetical protein